MFKFVQASQLCAFNPSAVRIETVRWRHRSIPLSRRRHVVGYYSPRPGCPLVPFESHTESRAIEYLYSLPGVYVVLSQVFTVEYRVGGGPLRPYTPDQLMVANPASPELAPLGLGGLTVIEVKATLDPAERAAIGFKLQVASYATGLPGILALPVQAEVALIGDTEEVKHAF